MTAPRSSTGVTFDVSCDVLVAGGGAAGLIAALRAKQAGADVLVVERDAVPRGSTALSAGLIPAAETRFQRAAGIADSKAQFAHDIMAKAHGEPRGEPDPRAVATVVDAVGPAIEWLAETHHMPFSVITNFTYPGHSAARMHGLPSRSGAELIDRLRAAAERAAIDIVASAPVTALFADADRRIAGVEIRRPDGSTERIGCHALVLATNGYGGNKAMVAESIPEMAGALYFGHPGNQGDAVRWGRALDADVRHLSGYQGHGSVAQPHGILITWATITEGGFQVNVRGERFANEARGYSEAASSVIAQPDGLAWTLFDARIAEIARQFEDFRTAEAAGAILGAGDIASLARAAKLPERALAETCRAVDALKIANATDAFGRDWRGKQALRAPFHAVRVTGALFHTQGGLVVDDAARVVDRAGEPLPNLFAAGGAACGVSGSTAAGYLSGNGLLTAVAYGFIAGAKAAQLGPAGDVRTTQADS
jgi:fumarate reductase flavoprotein subunit